MPLLLLGFGVKLALPGLHWWLPGAYAMAPAAAAAVLSGPMISAGLLGWLRFLPLAVPGLADWGTVLLWVGVAGVALGVLVGIVQHCPRRVLGYSSVAKMGVITAGFGVALGQPEHGVGIVTALGLFTLHHLLVKGTLFLGVGLWERAGARPWLFGGMTLLALAGAPLTGGAAAKVLLSASLAQAGVDLAGLLPAAVGTLLLMARMLWLLMRKAPAGDAPPVPALAGWALLLPALWLPFHPYQLPLDGDGWLPLLLGIAIFSAPVAPGVAAFALACPPGVARPAPVPALPAAGVGGAALVRRFILFYMFVGNALRGVPNSPRNGTEAVPYAI